MQLPTRQNLGAIVCIGYYNNSHMKMPTRNHQILQRPSIVTENNDSLRIVHGLSQALRYGWHNITYSKSIPYRTKTWQVDRFGVIIICHRYTLALLHRIMKHYYCAQRLE